MDKNEVRLMNQALQDLDEIYGYIARNLHEPGVVTELLDALEFEILSLEYLPYHCSDHTTVWSVALTPLLTAAIGSS